MEFRPWLILNEANQHEAQALKLLGGDQPTLAALNSFAGEAKFLPVLALLHRDQPDLAQLRGDWEEYLGLLKEKKMPTLATQGDRVVTPPSNQPLDYVQWTEKLHSLAGDRKLVQSRLEVDHSEHKPPIFKNDELEIYETDGPGDCIRYGKGYSFCISQPGNTMWQSYRDTQSSTFYFVYDKKREQSDPLHIVVVDMTEVKPILTDARNTTGNVSQYGGDANAYLKHLYQRGVPQGLFKNNPKTQREKEEHEALGYRRWNLQWFRELSPEYKSKYIGRGHELSDEQFDYVLDNGLDSLAKQYAEMGIKLTDHQMDRMLRSKFKGTYLHFRLIANQHRRDLSLKEYDALNDKQKESVGEEINVAMMILKGEPREKWPSLDRFAGSRQIARAVAARGDVEALKTVLKHSNPRDISCEGAMEAAAANNQHDAVEHLLERKVQAVPALTAAASAGHLEIFKKIADRIEESPDTYHAEKDGPFIRPLKAAFVHGRFEIFKYIVEKTMDISDPDQADDVKKCLQNGLYSTEKTADPEGQKEIVRYALARKLLNADFHRTVLYSGKESLIDLMTRTKEFGKDTIMDIIQNLAKKDQIEEIKRWLDEAPRRGVEIKFPAEEIAKGAAEGGKMRTLRFAVEEMAAESYAKRWVLRSAFVYSIFGKARNQTEVMEYLASQGALDEESNKDFVETAVKVNNLEAVKFLVSKGFGNLRLALQLHGQDKDILGRPVDRSAIYDYMKARELGEPTRPPE